MKPVLEIENLGKSFGTKVIFDRISFAVGQNEVLSVIGQSGTGKSVLLKNIMGIIKPDSGSIFVNGKNLYTNSGEIDREILSKMGILFQGAALFDSLDVYGNIMFGLERSKMDIMEKKRRFSDVLNSLGLRGYESKSVSELSGGIQKRVGLARAIVLKPEIMLYDEPTTGVDPITAGVVNSLILRMREIYGMTSIVVTHDIESACRISDRIIMLHGGNIIFSGTPSELMESTLEEVTDFVRR